MKTQKPDEWLKKSLHDLRVPTTEDEWKNIASSLDSSVPPAEQFLKENLSSIEGPVAADEWASIAASLDTAVPAGNSFFSRRMVFALSAVVLIALLWLLYPRENAPHQKTVEAPLKSGNMAASQQELPITKEEAIPNAGSSPAKKGNVSEPATNNQTAPVSGKGNIAANSNLNMDLQPEKDGLAQKLSDKKTPAKNVTPTKKAKVVLPAITGLGSKNTSIAKTENTTSTLKSIEKTESATLVNNSNSTPEKSEESVASKDKMREAGKEVQKKTEAPINEVAGTNEKPAEQKAEEPAEKLNSASEEAPIATVPLSDSSAEASKTNIPSVLSLPKKSGFLLGFSFSPEWAYRSWEPNADFDNKTHKEYKDLRNSQEKPRLSYSLSIHAEYRFAKGFMVQSGLIYSQKGFSTRYDYKVTQVPVVDANTGAILGYLSKLDTQGTRYSGGQSYTYMELPLIAGYQFKLSDKISLQLKAGGSLQYLVGTSGKTIDPATLDLVEISGQKSFKQRNFGYMFSAGISYAILPRMQLVVEPVYRKTAQPVTVSGNNYSQSFYSVGMNLGVMYKLF